MSHCASGERRSACESFYPLLPLRPPSLKSGGRGGGGRDSTGRSRCPSSTASLTERAPPSPSSAREAKTPRHVPSRGRLPGASPARQPWRRTELRPQMGLAGTSERGPRACPHAHDAPSPAHGPLSACAPPDGAFANRGPGRKRRSLRPPEAGPLAVCVLTRLPGRSDAHPTVHVSVLSSRHPGLTDPLTVHTEATSHAWLAAARGRSRPRPS